eukprot:14035160-Ditylum_brightwellii.AAC.1
MYKQSDINKETTFAKLNRSSALNRQWLIVSRSAVIGELQDQTLPVPSVIDTTFNKKNNDDVHLNMTITL